MYEFVLIKALVEKLNEWRDAYYNQDVSLVSDREYDAQFDKLVELEKKTGIILSGSPTQTVGYTVSSKLEKVKHNHLLLSLDKTTDINEFMDYFKGHDCLVMAKLDGLTCSITYKDGRLFRAETRGDGEIGEDITQNAKMFANLPLTIPFSGELVVDGECIITLDEFDRINKRENTEYKNPRNLVSGTVRQLDSSVVKSRNVKFLAWKLYYAEGKKTNSHYHRLVNLEHLGFDTVPNLCSLGTMKENIMLQKYIEIIKDDCEEHNIPIDGMVGMFDDVAYGESLGMTGHHPKHSLAFKFYQEENETILRDIEWSTSRTGAINPVAIFDPVEIDGTTVTRATLNNVSFIKELELGIGDTITVIKANQIIPMITQNLTRSNTYQLPATCPSCGHPVVIKNDNGREMMYCQNEKCMAILHDRIANFAARNGMNIVGISDERLKILINNGYIKQFKDIYYLCLYRDELARLNGFGSNIVDNLLNAIEDSRKCKFENVLVAIGIPNIGKSTARIIAEYCKKEYANQKDQFTNLLDFFVFRCEWNEKWDELPSIGQATKWAINDYVQANGAEIQGLVDELHIIEDEIKSESGGLDGKTFCITGKLVKFANRNALVYEIEKRGGKVVSSVTAKTNYLITNDKTSGSSKNKAAAKFGTKIISEDEFIAGKF